MFNIGPMELILILTLALVLFGPKKLPEMGKTVGRALSEFRKASADIRRELREGMNEAQAPPPGTPGTNGESAGSPGSSPAAGTPTGTSETRPMAPHPPSRPAPPADSTPGS